MSRERAASLDAARAIAMVFVIAAHAALSFMVTPVGWAVQDRAQHLGVDLFVWITRAFVMPSFFWLSGYFARAVFEQRGVTGFVRHRVTRVLLPLALALVPCSVALTALWAWGREVAGRAEVSAAIPRLRDSGLPVMLGHLWYLYYLLIFSAAAVVVALLARRARLRLPAAAVLLVPVALVSAVFLALGAVHTDTPLGFGLDVPIAIHMGAFFAWGWLVHAHPDELARYARHAYRVLALAPPLLGVCVATLYAGVAHAPIYASLASALFSIVLIVTLLGLCVRHAPRGHATVRLVSESSYWCYIAHLPLVVLLQVALASSAVPGPLKYLAIVGATCAVCVATYFVLVRRTVLRRVFG